VPYSRKPACTTRLANDAGQGKRKEREKRPHLRVGNACVEEGLARSALGSKMKAALAHGQQRHSCVGREKSGKGSRPTLPHHMKAAVRREDAIFSSRPVVNTQNIPVSSEVLKVAARRQQKERKRRTARGERNVLSAHLRQEGRVSQDLLGYRRGGGVAHGQKHQPRPPARLIFVCETVQAKKKSKKKIKEFNDRANKKKILANDGRRH
jgi:hypothetical protein